MSKWPLKKLGEHIIESKEQYSSEKLNGIQVLSVTNDQGFINSEKRTSENVSNYKIVKDKYFAYNPYRINVGSLAYARSKYVGIVSPAYVVFYCASDLDPEYLWKYLKSDVGLFHIRQGGKGSVRSSLSFERLQEIEIPLPPFPEQKRIVKKIRGIEEKSNEVKKQGNRSNFWRESILPSVWSILRTKFKDFDWTESSVGDICENPQYGYTAPATQKNVGPKMLRITDIQNSKVNWGSVPFCFFTEKDKEKYLLKDDDILFARTGGTTGKSYFVKNPPESVFASYLIRLRTKEAAVLPEYLYQYFQSRFYWDQVIDKKNGSAQPNLNGSKLKKIKIFYPGKIESQKKVINFLQELRQKTETLKMETENKQKYTTALMPSLLARAFNGEL